MVSQAAAYIAKTRRLAWTASGMDEVCQRLVEYGIDAEPLPCGEDIAVWDDASRMYFGTPAEDVGELLARCDIANETLGHCTGVYNAWVEDAPVYEIGPWLD